MRFGCVNMAGDLDLGYAERVPDSRGVVFPAAKSTDGRRSFLAIRPLAIPTPSFGDITECRRLEAGKSSWSHADRFNKFKEPVLGFGNDGVSLEAFH